MLKARIEPPHRADPVYVLLYLVDVVEPFMLRQQLSDFDAKSGSIVHWRVAAKSACLRLGKTRRSSDGQKGHMSALTFFPMNGYFE
jgi:hypothetical protein